MINNDVNNLIKYIKCAVLTIETSNLSQILRVHSAPLQAIVLRGWLTAQSFSPGTGAVPRSHCSVQLAVIHNSQVGRLCNRESPP